MGVPAPRVRFGIAVNNDAVVRTVYHKYLHPKEVFISNGILNKGIVDAVHRSGRKDVRGCAHTSTPGVVCRTHMRRARVCACVCVCLFV